MRLFLIVYTCLLCLYLFTAQPVKLRYTTHSYITKKHETTASSCNILQQHTATTYCNNILQHTAIYCNTHPLHHQQTLNCQTTLHHTLDTEIRMWLSNYTTPHTRHRNPNVTVKLHYTRHSTKRWQVWPSNCNTPQTRDKYKCDRQTKYTTNSTQKYKGDWQTALHHILEINIQMRPSNYTTPRTWPRNLTVKSNYITPHTQQRM